MWRNIILSGGSIYGLAHVGFIKYLEDQKLLSSLNKIIGSSIGSIIASFIAFGFAPDDIWNFILKLDMQVLAKLNMDPAFILENLGLNNGEIIYNFLNVVFERKTNIKDITFAQYNEWIISQGKSHHLIITGVCLNTGETVYFDHVRTPTMSVAKAVRISSSIPPLFTPVNHDGYLFVDGSIGDNFPIDEVKGEENETISSMIIIKYNLEVKNIEDYAYALMMLFSRRILYHDALKYEKNTVIIDRPNEGSAYDFDINNDFKTRLFELGYEKTRDFCEKKIKCVHNEEDNKHSTKDSNNEPTLNESINETRLDLDAILNDMLSSESKHNE
jgi:NTE family protein